MGETLRISIAGRYCGPPDSANGGYVSGVLARHLRPSGSGAVEVSLRRPPPLDRELSLVTEGEGDGATCQLWDGETLLAEARAAELELTLPRPPTLAEAERMSAHYIGFHQHASPTCFVCGTERAEGDGLRIFPGRPSDSPDAPVAALFRLDPSMAQEGAIAPEILWSALDCPGYFATLRNGTYALLGRMTAALHRPVRADERLVVVGYELAREGRKLFAGTALFDADGQAVASSRQIWITVP